jgi:hypothetical protein
MNTTRLELARDIARDVHALAESLRSAPPGILEAVNRRRVELRLAPVPVLPRRPSPQEAIRSRAAAVIAKLNTVRGRVGSAGKLPLYPRPHARFARNSRNFSKGAIG